MSTSTTKYWINKNNLFIQQASASCEEAKSQNILNQVIKTNQADTQIQNYGKSNKDLTKTP